MALISGKSGEFVLGAYNLFAKVTWQEKYSVEENYSIIYVDMHLMADGWDYVDTWFPGHRTDVCNVFVGSESIQTLNYFGTATHKAALTTVDQWVQVQKSGDGTTPPWESGKIYHNSDGSGSTTIAVEGLAAFRSHDDTTKRNRSIGTLSATAITLTTIPRASSITSAAAVTLGRACSVKWTPLSSGFQYKLKFSMGSWSGETDYIQPKTTSAYTYTGYTIPLAAARQIPSATSGTMNVTLETYNGTELVGSDDATFTVTVPENSSTKPTVTNLVLTPVDSPFDGVFVQGNSKVQAAFSNAGKYGASITSATMTVEGKSYTGDYISSNISGYGDLKVTVTVTDTRGFTGTAEGTISVCAYSKPQVKVSQCQRCDASGAADDSGTYLMIAASRSYSKVIDSSGTQNNFCKIRYRYAEEGGSFSSWQTLLANSNLTTDSVESGALLGSLATTSTYIVQVGVKDTVGKTNNAAYTIMTEAVFMHEKEGGKGLGLGMYCTEDNRLDVAWNMRVWGDLLVGPDGLTLEDYIKEIVGG